MEKLEIVYQDSDIVLLNKRAKMLTVPGKEIDKFPNLTTLFKKEFPSSIDHPAVHRLDYDTSGLILFALTKEAHRALSIDFSQQKVVKHYIALLEGVVQSQQGVIELAFRYDQLNKPRQKYDPVLGKVGITNYKKIGVENGYTRVLFNPITGRTHQLRTHSAHRLGLNCPIVGDSLYGSGDENSTLKLCATSLKFIHPTKNEEMNFTLESWF